MPSLDDHPPHDPGDDPGPRPRRSEPAAAHACRYLALAPDPSTVAMFACEEHRCFRVGDPLAVALSYQEAVCLCEAHADCPRFRDAQSPVPLQPRSGWRRWHPRR